MQQNLQQQRQRSLTPQQRYPVTSFHGPFFRLEEVGPDGQQTYAAEHVVEESVRASEMMRAKSSSDFDLDRERDETVIMWPPPSNASSSKDRRRSSSVTSRSILDTEEYRRQKQQELEAIRRREEKALEEREKQVLAFQLQQQRLYEQQGRLPHGSVTVAKADTLSPDIPSSGKPTPGSASASYSKPAC